jgi:hypothetical protein
VAAAILADISAGIHSYRHGEGIDRPSGFAPKKKHLIEKGTAWVGI